MLDSARTEGRGAKGIERKSGRVNERDSLRQLERERAGLESGQIAYSRWESVEGEKVPPAVAKEMQDLARDFPGRFHHEIVSRADALRAMQLGQSLASKQLELVRAYELDRANRARQRLENIRAIVQAREAKAREERGQTPQQTREKRQQKEREAAQRVAQEFTPPGQSPAREATDAADRAAQAERVAQQARDLAAQWQQSQIQAFKAKGMSPDLIRIMELIHKGMPAPGVPLPGAPELTSEVTRGGRAAERDRIRDRGLEKGGR